MQNRLRIILLICLCSLLNIVNTTNADHDTYVQHVEQGFLSLFQGDNHGAIEAFELAIDIEPEHYEILHYLGMAYAKENSLNKAIETYKRALDYNPNNIEGLYSLAVGYFKLNQWESAVVPLKKVIELSYQHARGHELLGKVYIKLRMNHEAVPVLTQAIELKPKSPENYNNLGTAYLNLEKYQNAIVNYTKAIEYGPANYALPHHGLGTTYLRLGDRDKSRRELQIYQRLQKQFAEYERLTRLTRNEPDNLVGWSGLAKLLMYEKKYNEVIPVLQRCIEIATKQNVSSEVLAGYNHGISQVFIQLNYPKPAHQFVSKAIQLQPNIPVYHNTLGSVYAMQGNVQNAIGAFRRAIELDSEQPLFHLNISKLYKSLGNHKLAQEHHKAYEYFLSKKNK